MRHIDILFKQILNNTQFIFLNNRSKELKKVDEIQIIKHLIAANLHNFFSVSIFKII